MAKQRTIVGSPLSPTLLNELGAVESLPSTPGDFKPAGEWGNTYRIWTCHGYRESGNQNVGFLRVQKKMGGGNTFELHIEQAILQTDAMLNTIKTQITCVNNEYASPIEWHLSSSLTGPTGKVMGELSTTESGSIEGNIMTIETTAGILHRQIDTPLTSDWSLFEAAQRWSVGEARHLLVNMLEGLHALKPEQHITYRGLPQMGDGPGATRLFHFVQLGPGILPTEFWLDMSHRLLIVTSMNKAYILDEQAEKIFTRDVDRARKTYFKKTTQRK
jgi:hypothetical protein